MQKVRNKLYSVLRWSEKYFKTDMVYLAKGGFWLSMAQAAAAITAFGMSIAYANWLSQDVYGSYKFILSVAAIIGAFSLTGLGLAVTQGTAKGNRGILKYAFVKNLCWSIPLMLIALGVSLYYAYSGNNTLAIAMLVVAIATPIINSSSLYGSFLTGVKDFKSFSKYWVINNTVTSLVILTTIYYTDSVLMIVSAYFVTMAVMNFLIYLRTLVKYKLERRDEKGVLSYSKHLSVINLLNTFTNHIDKILVFHYLGAAEVAIYVFALAIPDQVKGLLKNIPRLALPKFSEGSLENIQKTMFAKLWKFALAILVIVIMYIIAAPYIFDFFFPKYHESVFYTQILAFSMFGVIGLVPIAALQAQTRKKQLYIHAVLVNIIQIFLTVFLIKNYGLLGAVIAHLLMRVLIFIIPFVLLKRIKVNN